MWVVSVLERENDGIWFSGVCGSVSLCLYLKESVYPQGLRWLRVKGNGAATCRQPIGSRQSIIKPLLN
ncbi:hypothetical protein RchiOBHm_Chr2g0128941 [Rosa chinensis]|uniref:Uncharacterized protein n=1 Tax=Rosa chinensis TaxID=74649 RepID=A0A2P6RUG1_ROSCH|nr:hypothetical protein RchiOBHm_Chr2g0128941 [Rosa chinensis]